MSRIKPKKAKAPQADPPPITEAKTFAEFVIAVNAKFDTGLPESWPDGSIFAEIWALKIKVVRDIDGERYHAEAKTLYPKLGAGTSLAGRMCAQVTAEGHVRVANAAGAQALSLIDLIKEHNHG